jgi:hypothetical protein
MFTRFVNFIANTWVWFKSFFSEESGGSTTRFLNWIWIFFLCGNLTFLTIYGTLKKETPILPPMEATSGYVAITSLLLAAKVGQRVWGENGSNADVPLSGSVDGNSLGGVVNGAVSNIYSNILASLAAQYSGSSICNISGSISGTAIVVPTPVAPVAPVIPVVPIINSQPVDPNQPPPPVVTPIPLPINPT